MVALWGPNDACVETRRRCECGLVEHASTIGMMLLDAANRHPCHDPELARKVGAALVNGVAEQARNLRNLEGK